MLGSLVRRSNGTSMESRSSMSFNDYLEAVSKFSFNWFQYVVPSATNVELSALEGSRNSVVGVCISVRSMIFSEARFVWQRYSGGRPAGTFGSSALGVLERPWPAATTGDLLSRMELDVSLYGNSYWVRNGAQLMRLDPTSVLVVTGDAFQRTDRTYGAQLLGYSLADRNGNEIAFYLPDEVAHYRPLPV